MDPPHFSGKTLPSLPALIFLPPFSCLILSPAFPHNLRDPPRAQRFTDRPNFPGPSPPFPPLCPSVVSVVGSPKPNPQPLPVGGAGQETFPRSVLTSRKPPPGGRFWAELPLSPGPGPQPPAPSNRRPSPRSVLGVIAPRCPMRRHSPTTQMATNRRARSPCIPAASLVGVPRWFLWMDPQTPTPLVGGTGQGFPLGRVPGMVRAPCAF